MYICIYVYLDIYIYMYTNIHVYIHIYIHIKIYINIYICIYTCVYIFVCKYISYTQIHIYTYIPARPAHRVVCGRELCLQRTTGRLRLCMCVWAYETKIRFLFYLRDLVNCCTAASLQAVCSCVHACVCTRQGDEKGRMR